MYDYLYFRPSRRLEIAFSTLKKSEKLHFCRKKKHIVMETGPGGPWPRPLPRRRGPCNTGYARIWCYMITNQRVEEKITKNASNHNLA